jgi:hypothetical protein
MNLVIALLTGKNTKLLLIVLYAYKKVVFVQRNPNLIILPLSLHLESALVVALMALA